MFIEQRFWNASQGWKVVSSTIPADKSAQLVLIFGSGSAIHDSTLLAKVIADFPVAIVMGCSTAGEIHDTFVSDDSLVVTAIHFEKTSLSYSHISVAEASESYDAARKLVEKLPVEGLKHVFLLSDGLHVNGTELVKGLNEVLPDGVQVTGGLAGDGSDFNRTWIIQGEKVAEKQISAVGFYGNSIEIGCGSFGGWDSFGIDRRVTKSSSNVLYEIDGQPALELYKSFLGDKAAELPASGLLFPLSLRTKPDEPSLVRTILSVDEASQSITFAGDLPEGAYIKLMKANIDRLIDGANKAAEKSHETILGNAELAILISCVGRKLVLKQLVEEEVEGAREVLGTQAVLTGFYSYGEVSPFSSGSKCELHNQTMTITTLREVV